MLLDPVRNGTQPASWPRAETLELSITQPLLRLCENDIVNNPIHSKGVDQQTGRGTAAMIVAPVHVSQLVVGVLSGVKLLAPDGASPDSPRYTMGDLAVLQNAAEVLGELLTFRCLSEICGWEGR